MHATNGTAAIVPGAPATSSPRPAPMNVEKSQSPWSTMHTASSPVSRRTR